MKKDRLIKQELQSAFTPEKTFGEFCRENNIVPSKPEKKRSASSWLLKVALPTLSAAAVALAIVLPITLSDKTVPSGGQSAPQYNVYNDSVTVEEILADTDVTLFNLDYMYDASAVFYKMYMGDNAGENHVGYTVETKMYGAKVNDVPYVYGFTLTTAKKNALSVLDKSAYYGCDQSVSYDNVEYKYKVNMGLTAIMCVYYTIGKYEYFIDVAPYGTASIADEEYMQMFLRLAFSEVDNAERVQFKTN
ncbi:MAG: hypothetical protein J1F71_01910 [Clostridiales bacterium]|nr:hypothetical protein [Clostridiales bacterium]